MDTRLTLLHEWVEKTLGLSDFSLAPASADASFRRYFRLSADGEHRIIMDAPPEQEDCRPFIKVDRALQGIGLHVPEILCEDLEHGFIVLSDLGSTTYLSALDAGNAEKLYRDAIDALVILQRDYPDPAAELPPYDHALLHREMNLFRDWYLRTHLDLTLSSTAERLLDRTFVLLGEQALQQPRVAVHRDYHSRNLMVTEPNPGILDFQDAVYGPVSYDLVSLLRDCYIRWPDPQIANWRAHAFVMLHDAGVLTKVSDDQFTRWFDFMGVQRHLKATGIFARLNHRDAKPGYLCDIPRTLGYVLDVCAEYPELHEFGSFLADEVMPRLDKLGVPSV